MKSAVDRVSDKRRSTPSITAPTAVVTRRNPMSLAADMNDLLRVLFHCVRPECTRPSHNEILLAPSDELRRPAAVDGQDHAGDERGAVRYEERGNLGQLL